MSQDQIIDPKRRYLPAFQGLRGFGFLLVFCGHYLNPAQLVRADTITFKLMIVLRSLSVFAVPAFFVLSGYLIGGILYHTRNREGFFRVFYLRRFLRVFPVYYVTLGAIALFYVICHIHSDFYFWMQFLYIQNLLGGHIDQPMGPAVMTHFWSLAVEEQFYLLWPLIVWRFRDKSRLIAISSVLIVACCLLRLASPLLSISVHDMSFFTFNRIDAVLMGVLLNLLSGSELMKRITPSAKWLTLASVLLIAVLGAIKGEKWAMSTYAGKETWIAVANFTAAAIIIAVLEEGSFINRICSQRWICLVGGMSYSLYVFHLTYRDFFMDLVARKLAAHVQWTLAMLIAATLAFCTTFVLSLLSYRFIEKPLMNLKRHLPYGEAVMQSRMPPPRIEPQLSFPEQ